MTLSEESDGQFHYLKPQKHKTIVALVIIFCFLFTIIHHWTRGACFLIPLRWPWNNLGRGLMSHKNKVAIHLITPRTTRIILLIFFQQWKLISWHQLMELIMSSENSWIPWELWKIGTHEKGCVYVCVRSDVPWKYRGSTHRVQEVLWEMRGSLTEGMRGKPWHIGLVWKCHALKHHPAGCDEGKF